MDIAKQKETLRREARERRAALRMAAPGAGLRVAENFLVKVPLQKNSVVAGYIAARDELDPVELIAALRARGHKIALPRVAAKYAPLEFHLWEKNAAPVRGAYDLFEASPDWPTVVPNLLLVPLLAFDDDGHRLGYGGGYYDQTLRALRKSGNVTAIGVAYEGQHIARLPHDESDEKLDFVVTEKGVRTFP